MDIPSTGTSWRAGGFSDIDSRLGTRGGLASILIRNNRGSSTNISPWRLGVGGVPERNWSPFAEDGQPRDDLFAHILVDGDWITNPDPNEGFHLIGAMTEDGGPERAPDISTDDQMVLQSNMPFDSALTGEGLSVNFTGVETIKPLLKRLRMNLMINDSNGDSICEDPGTEHFAIGKPVDNEGPEYQIILMFANRKRGEFLYTAEGYSLAKLNDIGSFRRSKTDPDAGSLGYKVLPDPYFVGKDPNDPTSNELIPLYYAEWIDGESWTGIKGAS